MIKVNDEQMKFLRELRASADRLAFMVGVLRIEHRLAELRLIEEGGGVPDKLKYGSLTLEYQQREAFFMSKVSENTLQQRAAGEAALKELGLDFTKRELMIDFQSAEVRELKDGVWHEACALKGEASNGV